MDIKYLDYQSLSALRKLVGDHRHSEVLEWRRINEVDDSRWKEKKDFLLGTIDSESPFGVWNRILNQIQETESNIQETLALNHEQTEKGGTGRIARIERPMEALRNGETNFLRTKKSYANLMDELSELMSTGGHVDEVFCAIADLIEEVLGSE